MKKLFGNFEISYKFLIIFSIMLGIVVGILNRIPFLNNTSFQDIAIVLDMWFILAIFIIVNCKNVKEAICKCFIFFLISQPIIYFTEVIIDTVFYNKDFVDTFILYFKNYYIRAGWFNLTILTIPGAFIAYQIKKNNVMSAIILSVATCYLAVMGTKGLLSSIFNNFPYHLLNSLICLVMAFYLIFIILKNKKERIIATCITIVGLVGGIFLFINSSNEPLQTSKIVDFEEGVIAVDYRVDNNQIAQVIIEEDRKSMTVYSASEVGETEIVITDKNNKEYVYVVNSTKDEFIVKFEHNN